MANSDSLAARDLRVSPTEQFSGDCSSSVGSISSALRQLEDIFPDNCSQRVQHRRNRTKQWNRKINETNERCTRGVSGGYRTADQWVSKRIMYLPECESHWNTYLSAPEKRQATNSPGTPGAKSKISMTNLGTNCQRTNRTGEKYTFYQLSISTIDPLKKWSCCCCCCLRVKWSQLWCVEVLWLLSCSCHLIAKFLLEFLTLSLWSDWNAN